MRLKLNSLTLVLIAHSFSLWGLFHWVLTFSFKIYQYSNIKLSMIKKSISSWHEFTQLPGIQSLDRTSGQNWIFQAIFSINGWRSRQPQKKSTLSVQKSRPCKIKMFLTSHKKPHIKRMNPILNQTDKV